LITVAIDAEHTRQTSAGTARASTSLIEALGQRDDIRPVALGGGPLLERGSLRKRLATARQELLWYPWLGRRRAAAAGADIYHCPTLRAPLTRGKPPLVVTVHDLVPVLFPETMTPWSRLYTRATLRHVLGAADIVTASSNATANDLVSLLGVSADRLRVVWLGVDRIFFSAPEREPDSDRPYVLFVGTPEPRKNLGRLVEAMELLRSRGYPHRLVIAGGTGWGRVRVDSSAVELAGRVSDGRLLELYANSACLALPSLSEGFGFPALEAMAAGTPVVAGARGSLPEIVGNAGVLIDPYDVSAIASGIERAISDRENLIIAGRARAARFSWTKTAESMAAVYRELM
jgi:glycosyltransferase involved in cell wall biosynthesis